MPRIGQFNSPTNINQASKNPSSGEDSNGKNNTTDWNSLTKVKPQGFENNQQPKSVDEKLTEYRDAARQAHEKGNKESAAFYDNLLQKNLEKYSKGSVNDDGSYSYAESDTLRILGGIIKQHQGPDGNPAVTRKYQAKMEQILKDNPPMLSREQVSHLSHKGKIQYYHTLGMRAKTLGRQEAFEYNKKRYETAKKKYDVAMMEKEIRDTNHAMTPEEAKHFLDDRYQESIAEIQGASSYSAHLAKVYHELAGKYPVLRSVKVANKPVPENAYFKMRDGRYGNAPSVSFNFNDIENNYLCLEVDQLDKLDEPQRTKVDSRRRLLQQFALQVGAQPSDLYKNRRLVSIFIFAHEMGHAYDFLHNELKARSGDQLDLKTITNTVKDSDNRRRREDMLMPIPRLTKFSKGTKPSIKRRLQAMGINDKEEQRIAQGVAYRERPQEKFADNFATQYIMDHYDEFFGNQKDGQHIETTVNNRLDISKDLDILDLTSSKHINLQAVKWAKDNRKLISGPNVFDCYLDKRLKIGSPIDLCMNGDPRDNTKGNKSTSPANLKRVGIIPEKIQNAENQHLVHNRIIMELENGQMFEMTKQKEEAPWQKETVESMVANLHITDDSTVQFMKRKNNDISQVDEGYCFVGKLERPLALGHGVYFKGGNTISNIQEVRRRWNTYYIRTFSDSIYEVIPYPEEEK